MNIYDPDSSDSDMLESLSYSVWNYWDKIQLNINTDFSVTGCMLCVIHHIHKDANDNSDSDHRKQVNNTIKTLFFGLYVDGFHFTLDLFCT